MLEMTLKSLFKRTGGTGNLKEDWNYSDDNDVEISKIIE